jgi:hypothetical protein
MGNLIDSLSIDGGFGKHPSVTSISFWNSEVQKLRDFAAQRAQYAVQYLNSMLGLSGRANLKITSNVQSQGKVTVNYFFESFGTENLYFRIFLLQFKLTHLRLFIQTVEGSRVINKN